MRIRKMATAGAVAIVASLAWTGTAVAAPDDQTVPAAPSQSKGADTAMALPMTAPFLQQNPVRANGRDPKAGAAAEPCWLDGRWWCHNVAGAPIYEAESHPPKQIDTMQTTTSWFVCRTEGDSHGEGPHPNRYIWTQGDNGAWGWMKDSSISSETNPLPTC